MVISQGEVWWADLGEPIGSGPGFRRPVVVIQADALNRSQIGTVVCVPLTSNLKWSNAPGNVLLKSRVTRLPKDSVANVSLIVALDKGQLTDRSGKLPSRQLDQATQRFEVGLIAITDVKAAQARYDLSVSLEIRALSKLVEAKDALREVAGAYYDNLAPLKADLKLEPPQPDSPESWIEQAKKQNLKIMAAQARTDTAQQEIRRQRAGHQIGRAHV